MDGKLLELSEVQWEFLAVLDALTDGVSADIVGELCPLAPGPLMDLLDKCTEADLIRKIGKNILKLGPDLPGTVRARLAVFRTPTWLSRMINKLNEFGYTDNVAPEIMANLLNQSGRDEEAARINLRLAQISLNRRDEAKALDYMHRALRQLSTYLGSYENDAMFISTALEISNLSIALGKELPEIPKILEKAKAASDRLGDRRSIALIHLHLGRILFLGNRHYEAIDFFARGESEVEALGDDDIMEAAAEFLALYYFMRGKFDKSMNYFERAVRSLESYAGVKLTNPSALVWMGLNAAYIGQFHRAIGLLDFHWRHAKREAHYALATTIQAVLGTVLLLSGNKREGSFHLYLALEQATSSNNFLARLFAQAGIALKHFNEGHISEAWQLASELAEEMSIQGMLGHLSSPWILEMVYEFQRLGYPPVLGTDYNKFEEQILKGTNIHLQGVALRLRAKNAFARGENCTQVENDLLASEKLHKVSGDPIQLAKTRVEMAILKLSQGNKEQACTLAQKAREGLSGPFEEHFPDLLRPLLDEERVNWEAKDYGNELMELLFQITSGISTNPSVRYVMHLLVSAVNRFLGAERGCLFWSKEKKAEGLELQESRNLSREEVLSDSFRSNMALILRCFRENKPILIRAKRAIVCLPLDLGKQGRGVLYHDNSYLPDCFNSLDESMLSRLATQLSTHVEQVFEVTRAMKDKKQSILEQSARMEWENDSEILFESPIMSKLLDETDRVARSEAAVLIGGETGVGKELLARRIHKKSNRQAGPLITIDPATIPETLLESELFGHEKGAFTGADRQRPGRIELAHRGTLFIDEVGEIPKSIQVKLLRVLEEKEFLRIGGRRPIKSDFRLISATNRDLRAEVEKGHLRKDFYYRINVVSVTLPPLRDRGEDVILLGEHFLRYYSRKNNLPELKLTSEDKIRLRAYDWPGNVRELKNVMERAAILRTLREFEIDLKPQSKPSSIHPFADFPKLEELERRYIRYVLEKTNQKIAGPAGAAESLGMKRTTLYSRMKKLHIALP